MKLDLNDLQPKEAHFELSDKPGVKLTLSRMTLRVQIWLDERYGQDNIKRIFTNQSLREISEICFYLLKDKSAFTNEKGQPSVKIFQESIVNTKDKAAIMTALLETIGISQPVLEKLSAQYDEEQKKSLIGEKSSTQSQVSTGTP